MKRVLCLYRVSTIGQVDHDDIPMQRIACREFIAQHPDWKLTEEISEKGVSGYKTKTEDRDALVQIKEKALAKTFDILLVFMFDRIGRRDNETPFVVQWFVENGIEVWSTKEGEQRFDSHVDKLLNYIRFWQASGESRKDIHAHPYQTSSDDTGRLVQRWPRSIWISAGASGQNQQEESAGSRSRN